MNIGILGTGLVGRLHAARLFELGHNVMLGTRNVDNTLASQEIDPMSNQIFSEWHQANYGVKLGSFTEASEFGEMVINALKGEVVLQVLGDLKSELKDKILIDISNPLDFSKGMPPFLSISNTDSLGEQVQAALSGTGVVKAFNTVNAYLQVRPVTLANGDHDLFLCGNDDQAKIKVIEFAKEYGWKNIIDLGDISNSRGMEMMMPMWLRLWGALDTANFNYKIVR